MENKDYKVLYIDAFNLFFRMFSAFEAQDSNGEPMGGFVGSVVNIQKLVEKFKVQEVIVCFDGPDAGMRRRSIHKEYKGKRGRKKRFSVVKIGDEKELVDNEQEQLKLLYSFLKHLPVKVVVVPYYEADDVIGYLVSKNQQYTNIIVSADKDYLQLVNANTFVWSPQKKILYTPEVLTAEWKTSPENLTYVRALIGDSSDKLAGVKGIGQDTVFKLLPQLHTEVYENFDQFWEQVENLEEGKSKTIKNLKENKEQAKTMYKLMKLDYTCLNQKAIEMLQVQLDEQQGKDFSKVSFKLFCVKQKLESYIKNFDLWIRPFLFLKKDVKLKV